ncbi:hypothetical protein MMSR116_29415 [Methylobacterium mesophilicum SR1.6/6]|uniref:Uncharacterized protein n=1 Tax=Methylobacterium mesophilicum SR1.6/6 TaxID=908290 RepID=A0A6B9FUZ4_9HYPH|nr:hypothetical protein [Methylobacterium mesophilicum]QGY05556.1 hypothetical protein MMSR116_29415 [Methylobacterium mesophilicum SR1.6/6]
MNGPTTARALVMGVLVLFLVLGILLIPVLEAELRRATAKKIVAEAAASDNARKGAPQPERQVG